MSNSEIIAAYFKAIQTGDLAKLGALVAADWSCHGLVPVSFEQCLL